MTLTLLNSLLWFACALNLFSAIYTTRRYMKFYKNPLKGKSILVVNDRDRKPFRVYEITKTEKFTIYVTDFVDTQKENQ